MAFLLCLFATLLRQLCDNLGSLLVECPPDNGDFSKIKEVSENSMDAIREGTISPQSMIRKLITQSRHPWPPDPPAESAAGAATADALVEGAVGGTAVGAPAEGVATAMGSGVVVPQSTVETRNSGSKSSYDLPLSDRCSRIWLWQEGELINSAVSSLDEQLQQEQDDEIASWIHTTEQYDRPFHQHEYAQKACARRGGEIRMTGSNIQLCIHRAQWNGWHQTSPRMLPKMKLINFNCLLKHMILGISIAGATAQQHPQLARSFCRRVHRQRPNYQREVPRTGVQATMTATPGEWDELIRKTGCVYNLGNVADYSA